MKLFTLSQLAIELNVSRNTVYKWVSMGLPAIRVPGSPPRFQLDRVTDWLKQFERSAVNVPEPSRIACKPVSDPARGEVTGGFPKGVYGEPGKALMISYPIPDGHKTRRVRESSGTRDPEKAAAIRREKLRSAWRSAPPSLNREKYLREAETD
jgi:excisionase family DNA binding protein